MTASKFIFRDDDSSQFDSPKEIKMSPLKLRLQNIESDEDHLAKKYKNLEMAPQRPSTLPVNENVNGLNQQPF